MSLRPTWIASAGLLLALLACSLPGSLAPPPTSAAPPTEAPIPVTVSPATAASPTPGAPTAPASATPAPSPTWAPPAHHIAIRNTAGVAGFYDRRTGAAFVPRGVNYAYVPVGDRFVNTPLQVGQYDPALVRADFSRLAGYGYNTVRVFLDHCSDGVGCIGRPDGEGLDPVYLDNLADMLVAAQSAGVFLLFTSNDLPDQGGYADEANSQVGEHFAGYRNAYYLTPAAVRATRRYWRDLLTGLVERRAPLDRVLGWQLLNEQWMFNDQPPLSLTAGLVETTTGQYDMSDPSQKRRMVADGLVHYIAEMRAEILTHDPTALVTMGFFAPGIGAPEWYRDTASLLPAAALDFYDFHAYPGGLSLAQHAEHFGMLGYAEKPIILGEYGAFRNQYGNLAGAANVLIDWVADSCAVGFDGWLHWAYYPTNPEVNDRTWGFTDEDGRLMELLAPVNQPDPCVPVDVPGVNLAFGRPVRASSVLPEEPAAYAVDEFGPSQWGSGGDAPQWIEVDLEGVYRLTEVLLLVAQFPEGPTTHRLHVRAEASAAGTLVHEFTGSTRDGVWLSFSPITPIDNVRYLRITTTTSPSWVSWREIQVFGEPAGP